MKVKSGKERELLAAFEKWEPELKPKSPEAIASLDIIPVLLHNGFRPFEDIGTIRLERIKVAELPAGRTEIRFRLIG